MWTLPNLLTVARVIAAPCVALAFVVFDRPLADWAAVMLFVIAAVTDWIDGWYARLYGAESAFGRMLDPIADKAMVVIALALLMALHGLGWSLVVPVTVILLRETLVAGLREFLAGAPVLSVTRLAKWKTTVQLVAVAALLAVEPAGFFGVGAMMKSLGLALLWIAATLTAVTGWDYFTKGLAHLRARQGEA